MDVLNLGKMKKKKGVTATPKVASAQNAIVNHSSTIGKSRVQGNQGVTQGNQGWKSQYTDAGAGYSKQINPIINSLSQAPTYDAPKIEHNLTTQEGFNEALDVVRARNNAKLASQNQRVLQGVLGSLISGDSQNRATTSRANIARMADATDRRGQDMTATSRANTLAETANRNKMLGKYYEGQNAIGKERNSIARDKMESVANASSNAKEDYLFRAKMFPDANSFKAKLSPEVYDEIGDRNLEQARLMYLETGKMPTFKKENTPWSQNPVKAFGEFFDDDYAPQSQPTTQTPQQPKQEVFKLDTNQTNTALHAYAQDQGYNLSDLHEKDGQIVTPDGTVSLKSVWERINNGNVR